MPRVLHLVLISQRYKPPCPQHHNQSAKISLQFVEIHFLSSIMGCLSRKKKTQQQSKSAGKKKEEEGLQMLQCCKCFKETRGEFHGSFLEKCDHCEHEPCHGCWLLNQPRLMGKRSSCWLDTAGETVEERQSGARV
jgi:hypothetical protein